MIKYKACLRLTKIICNFYGFIFSILLNLLFIYFSDLNTHKRKLSSGGLTRNKSLKAKENDIKLDPEVNESASYLIDKMFSSGTKTATTKSPTKSPKSDRFTEHALYREAKLYEFGKENAKDDVASKKQSRQSSKKKPVENPEPVNVSPVEISKKQVEDNVSESGTYTIEADESISKDEEEKARENIDKAFGLDNDYLSQTSTEPGIKSQKCLKNDELEVEDIEDQIEELEKVRAHGPEAESLDVEVGSDVLTELKIVEDGVSIYYHTGLYHMRVFQACIQYYRLSEKCEAVLLENDLLENYKLQYIL